MAACTATFNPASGDCNTGNCATYGTEDVQEAIVDIYAGFIAGMAGLSQSWGTAILAMIVVSMFFIAIMKILTRNLIALTHEE